MNLLKINVFIVLFFVFVHNSIAQEFYYVAESGKFIDSEENALVKYIVENEGNDHFKLLYSIKINSEWSNPEFSQKAWKVSDSIYHVSVSKNFKDYSVRQVISKQGDIITLRQFTKDGNLEFECQALNTFPIIMNGKTTYFDGEALPMVEETYIKGRRISEHLLFNPVDTTKEITKEPQFPGGIEEFRKHIARNVKFPVKTMEKGGMGKPYVKFRIDETGKMMDVSLARNPENELSRELINVIRNTKAKWQPAECDGEKIPVWYYATVKFVSYGVVN